MLVCGAPHGEASCVGVRCVVLCGVVLCVVVVCGPALGGARCVRVRCVVLCGVVCCGDVWRPVWWGMLWWCVVPLMVGRPLLACVGRFFLVVVLLLLGRDGRANPCPFVVSLEPA